MNYVLVLDVAKGKNMFMLSSDIGEVLLEPTEYIHNKSYFEKIDSYINKLNIKDNLTVVMEATSIYHNHQKDFLKKIIIMLLSLILLLVKKLLTQSEKQKPISKTALN